MDRVNTHMVMPQHLNAANTLFGGQMMAWMDESAAIFAMEIMKTNRIVTACFNKLDFLAPAYQGELVDIACEVEREGTTSLTIKVAAWSHSPERGCRHVCNTSAVFVALDETGKPTPWQK